MAKSPERWRDIKASELVLGQLTGRGGPAPGVLFERRAGERRDAVMRSLAYGGVRPRRRAGRRDGDAQRVFLDWHEPRVLYLALAVLLMSCVDALLTLNILEAGGSEVNVLMDWLISRDTGSFVATKIAITGSGVILLVLAVNRHFLGRVPVIHVLRTFCFGYAALIAWELFLLAQMFPGVAGGGSAAWAGVLG
jgi:hypothetical protein